MSQPKLSILIPSLRRRELFLDRLTRCLLPQLAGHDCIEVLTEIDNGEMSLGSKRNLLLRKATGEYVAFIDDDDLVADDYITKMLAALDTAPDVIGFTMLVTNDGAWPEYGFVSVALRSWFQIPDPITKGRFAYYSCPNHLTPVKRDLALSICYSDKLIMCEDLEYSIRLLQHLTREFFIESPIYYFLRRRDARAPERDLFSEGNNLEALHKELQRVSKNELRYRMQCGIASPQNREEHTAGVFETSQSD